jgi:hypothetical protein
MKMKLYARIAVASVLIFGVNLALHAQGYDSLMWVPNGPVNAIVKNSTDIYLGGDFNYVGKPTGFAVPVDSGTGLPVFTHFPKVDGPVYAIAPDWAGGWYIGGDFTTVGGQPRRNFARIKGNGTVMPITIDPDGPVYTIETYPTYGSPYVFFGGDFHNCDGMPVFNLCQLNSMTQHLYSTFAPVVTGGAVRSLKLVGGTLWVGGSFTNIDGLQGTAYLAVMSSSRNYIPQFNTASGSMVYNPNSPSGTVYAIYYNKPTNSIFIGGSFTFAGPNFRSHIAQYNASTLAVTAWNPNITGNVLSISGLQVPLPSGTQEDPGTGRLMDPALQSGPSNTIYVGGSFISINGNPVNGFAELDIATPNLISATTANANCNGTVWSIYADKPRNKIYVGGTFTSLGGSSCFNLACLDTACTNRNWPVSVGNTVRAIFSSGKRVYIGSESPCMYGNPTGPLISVSASTGTVNSWTPAINGRIDAMSLSPGNLLYVAGSFTMLQTSPRNNLGAIDLSTGLTTSFNPGCNGTIRTMTLSGQKLYVGGYFSTIGGESRSNVACIDVGTSQATAWSPVANGTVNSLTLVNGRIYCGGYFSNIGGANIDKLACVDTVGGYYVGTWAPDVNDGVYTVAAAGNTLLGGGWFTNVNGSSRSNFCSLDLSNGSLSAYNPSPDGTVHALAVFGNYAFAGGDFLNFGNANRKRFAAFDINSGTLQNLHTSFSSTPLAFLLDGNELYVGGKFTGLESDVHAYFTKIHTWYLLGENENQAQEGDFTVYPNPTAGTLSLTGPAAGDVVITVYNATGDLVLCQREHAHGQVQSRIDLSAMDAGLYFIRIDDGKEVRSTKVMITR